MDSPILYIAYSLAWCAIKSMAVLAYSDGWGGRQIRGRQQKSDENVGSLGCVLCEKDQRGLPWLRATGL